METTIREIAVLLRSTDEMAARFVERVQSRVGHTVSDTEILATMKKIPTKSLSMEKVVAKVYQQQKSARRKTSQRQTAHADSSTSKQANSSRPKAAVVSPTSSQKEPKTILEKLAFVLDENWGRAEAEGLQPERMSVEEFMSAIYQHTDRREGTRRRILEAAQQLDQDDILLTPALVADVVHELFEA
jgi:hypothetical protein